MATDPNLTSDLSETAPIYPGTPLTRRYSPDSPAKVANITSRGIQPVALGGSVNLPVSGERIFEFPDALRKPLEARVGRLLNNSLPTNAPPSTPSAPIPLVNQAAPDYLKTHTELEQLKEIARTELAKRQSFSPPVTTPTQPIIPLENPVMPITAPASASAAIPATTPAPESEDATKRLLSEAKELQQELAGLQTQLIPTPPPQPEQGQTVSDLNQQQLNQYSIQISQLIADKTNLLKQVNELTKLNSEEVGKRKEIDLKLANIVKDFEARLGQLKSENEILTNQVKTLELEKLSKQQEKASEQLLVSQLQQQLEQLKSDKETISEKIAQAGETKEQQIQATADIGAVKQELDSLKIRLDTANQERDDAVSQVKKLEYLLDEIRRAQKPGEGVPSAKETVRPVEAAKVTEKEATVRLVKPQMAVGKMAPSLTTAPNVINGIVRDHQGLILSSVIIVVKDPKGEPVRALKTNKIGQFAISTPLPNGTYIMELESPGYSFDNVEVDVKGEVLPPIEIRAN